MFKEETLQKEGRREYEEPDGEFLAMIDSGSNTITVLTRIDDSDKARSVAEEVDPSSLTVSELEEALEEGDFGEDVLAALIEVETENKDRKTAVDAILEYQ